MRIAISPPIQKIVSKPWIATASSAACCFRRQDSIWRRWRKNRTLPRSAAPTTIGCTITARADRKRLMGVGVIPVQDVKLAIDEAKRAVNELGFRGIFVRPNPIKGRNIDDAYYDPLYKTVVELGVPLLVHEGSGAFLPTAGADRFAGQWFFTHTISHPLEQMLASLALICRGALERNPELQVVFLESGAGWLPYWLWRMDEHYEILPFQVPWLKMKPSDYFRRQCFTSFEADETRLGDVIESIGADRVLFASDYPHWDATFPGVTKMILDRKDMNAETKRKVMGENAARLLRLD